MRTPRFFLPQPLNKGARLALPDTVFRHAVHVLRLKPGTELIVFNGGGGEYRARLDTVERRRAYVQIGAFDPREAESTLAVTLAQAVAKAERMDSALQKAVELGAQALVPLYSERSVPLPDPARQHKRQQHWQGVVVAACEQCGRNRVPGLAAAQSLTDWLTEPSPDGAVKLILDPGGGQTLSQLAPPRSPASIVLLIGPEGGWSDCELALAKRAGFSGLRLGPRVLRTETAGSTALAALHALWGDFR